MVVRSHCGLLTAMGLALLVGCSGNQPIGGDKEKKSEAAGTPQPRKAEEGGEVATAQQRKADFTLTAEEITREFLADEKAADKKYKGKVLAITGDVEGVGSPEGGQIAIIILKGARKNEQDLSGSRVSFVPVPAFTETALKLSGEQKVKVTGEYAEYDNFVRSIGVTKGSLEELSKPENLVSISAADLAREVGKDSKAAEAKYAGKDLIVSGEVEELVRQPEKGLYFTQLKGDGKRSVAIFMGAQDFTYLKKGRTARLRGAWRPQAETGLIGVHPRQDQVRLYAGIIVEAK
jgi:hypothetical protein